MAFVLGTDEAGYGPNLGPLCIAASAWQLAEDSAADNLYERLAKVVSHDTATARGRVVLADSKQLYKPGATLATLERGVLMALSALHKLPCRWREIWRLLDRDALPQIDTLPWHAGFDEPLPLHAQADELSAPQRPFCDGCRAAGVQLAALEAAVLFPAAFNAAVKQSANKAEVLSLTTLRLVRRVLEGLPPGRAVVLCDKHGGRSRYAALLQHVYADELVVIKQETPDLSVYQTRHADRLLEFRFQPRGEQHLPTALASMTAKYLRELAMRPFNAFWQQLVPDLKPTAGYPTDARRFFEAIRPARQRLQIADGLVWRSR